MIAEQGKAVAIDKVAQLSPGRIIGKVTLSYPEKDFAREMSRPSGLNDARVVVQQLVVLQHLIAGVKAKAFQKIAKLSGRGTLTVVALEATIQGHRDLGAIGGEITRVQVDDRWPPRRFGLDKAAFDEPGGKQAKIAAARKADAKRPNHHHAHR